MITSPVERRLITEPDRPEQLVRGMVEIRAKAWGIGGAASPVVQVDDRPLMDMSLAGSSSVWSCRWDSTTVDSGEHRITVRIRGANGSAEEDTIDVLVGQDASYQRPDFAIGDAENAIGPYSSKGILGTQLGPNKNGRKW